ncbi:AraC family transcriptional regulator of adaptative response/methylated-DNA-[protein]-cysteine methyltransferase [Inquilinus ginsengisoli]|uniref:AraC family transcriptional regulator of adaptative response/methylated-DNA-[protein]-cysteine methyltransferase n=1 Tax=Inquilinus ginsengisoli TaxID=363840 RepID=A0ABU1JXT8_9PROT|nr:methylated-DNA--[protein]-cysteine S-methyltransferase [Inquilinus ginsengisoli]MDR6292384.1 AraC family transcriptional regulator of adaptative response/methylated-DNA-[protein]-cysteine methyltransferase [Inquilinus ginsengisoli]
MSTHPASSPAEEDEPFHEAISRAIAILVERREDPPDLTALAAEVGLHPHHFQRVFSRWVGISPKRFVQYLRLDHAKRLLSAPTSLLDAALDTGLSGPSRLHDLFVTCEAMTPGDWKGRGAGLTIRWGLHASPFGPSLIGTTDRGVCWFSFVVGGEAAAIAEFAGEWPGAELVRDQAATAEVAARMFAPVAGPATGSLPLPVLLRGTNFQVKVWEALLSIPSGRVASYGDVAAAIGRPSASRAVGGAVGSNPVSVLIPCHRVIRSSGVIHNYRWGADKKQALLAWEAARTSAAA